MTLQVLHVTQPTEAGVARCVIDTVHDQVRRGWLVRVAAPQSGPLADWVLAAGAEHVPWEATREPTAGVPVEVQRLRSILRQRPPDLVHLHSSKAGLAGRLAVRGRQPTIFEPHSWSFVSTRSLVKAAALAWERRTTSWTDRIICVSEAERRVAEEAGLSANWRVIPNAVDLDRFRPGGADRSMLRRELGLDGDVPLALCVGRICRQKGQDILLAAWPAVRNAVPNARLVLLGDGPWRSRLEAAKPDGVVFAGATADVLPWLRAVDVLVFPSRWEGLSLALLEAMASGRSVVATNVSGMSEAVGSGPGAGGAIVPPEDPVTLASALVERLRQPELTAREGTAARRRMVAGHDLHRRQAAVAALCLEVVADRHGAAGRPRVGRCRRPSMINDRCVG